MDDLAQQRRQMISQGAKLALIFLILKYKKEGKSDAESLSLAVEEISRTVEPVLVAQLRDQLWPGKRQ